MGIPHQRRGERNEPRQHSLLTGSGNGHLPRIRHSDCRQAGMKSKVSWIAIIVAVVAVAAGISVAQGKYRQRANRGPYHVMLSKPIASLNYQAGSLYREHEYLSAMLNQLDQDGMTPLLTNTIVDRNDPKFPTERLVVICVEK